MLLNNINLSDRNNRPMVLSKVGLQAFFISDGEYTDPYEISAVTIFQASSNFYPSSVLNSDTQLIDTSAVSGLILMNFANSSSDVDNAAFNPSGYSQTISTTSGIYRVGVGKYVVVLDGTINSSGVIKFDGLNRVVKNGASSAGDYIDVWTITWGAGSLPQTVINNFSLQERNRPVILTEPLMLKLKSRLVNSKVSLGTKVDLKIATNVHVENKLIDESIKEFLRDSVITSGSIQIEKINENEYLPSHVTVSSFADTSSLVSITADNVMLFSWDTSLLSTHPQMLLGNFGSIRGVYSIKAKYTVFDETLVTEPMYLTLS
jgi:hypothetical protein